MTATVAVIIVNYRTADLTIACLRSLAVEAATVTATRVVVVDNASRDGSADAIARAIAIEDWGAWATVLRLESNRGFSAGNNAGIRLCASEPEPPAWFLLLNPDTVIRPGALQALLHRGQLRPRIGLVGSRLEDLDGTPQASAFRFHSVASEFERGLRLGVVSKMLAPWLVALPTPTEACKVDWVSGASMLVRRSLLEQIGFLDERYFLYHEETDLCLRAARAGWECWHEPRSRVIHLVHASTGVDPADTVKRLPTYILESRRRFFVKNFGRSYAILADVAWLSGHLAYRLRMRLQRRPACVASGLLEDFIRHSALFDRNAK
jgi:GT2 family glycosyltransferase